MTAEDTTNEDPQSAPSEPSRRAFLTGAGAVAATALAAAACAAEDGSPLLSDEGRAVIAEAETQAQPTPTDVPVQATTASSERPITEIAFTGDRQSSVLVPTTESGLVAAFDVLVTSREELVATMQDASAEIQRLMANGQLDQVDEFRVPVESGAIGPETTTTGVAITVAVGATLFDDRFGLADRRPRELILMPRFFNDRLVRDDLSHGDLSFTITGHDQQAVVFALHQIVRVTERRLRLRWTQDGFNQILPEEANTIAETRNLMGFRDGTSNLDSTQPQVMDDFVWVGPDDGEPAWAVGGSYQAVRIIRILVEFWGTAALVRQEQIFGRHRESGAPLGLENEGDEPSFVSNPADPNAPTRSHIRLANPRTPDAARIMRRGFSYVNGAAPDGTMDQGLLFTCYQRSLSRGFVEVQSRLDGEPLEEYIKPVGGGLFFVLPGPGDDGGWLGQSLLT